MSLVRPDANVVIDGRTLTAAEGAISEISVELGVDGAFDRVSLTLSSLSPVTDSIFGAALQVSMGNRGDLVDVFHGVVVEAQSTPSGLFVEALTDAVALGATRIGRAYIDQTAADIARDLISSGGVTAGTVEAPLELAAYHVDERRSAWRHLRELSRLSGCALRSNADGAVDFSPIRSGRADHVLRRGAELVSWQIGDAGAIGEAPDVVPSGAQSEAGSSRWQFLLAEPDGGAPSTPTVVPAAIRTRDAARNFADVLTKAATRRSATGWLISTGVPKIRAGDLVDVTELQHGPDATWRVLTARHCLDGGGLWSRIRLEAAA